MSIVTAAIQRESDRQEDLHERDRVDAAFCYAAFRAAGKEIARFSDQDTVRFVRLDPYSHKISDDFATQVRYWKMRKAGESHEMAEMLALRRFPGIRGTDSVFMAGTHHQETPIDKLRHHYASQAGVDTNGRRYISGLARYPNDPEAWVSGSGDVLRICRERGWNCSGLVDYEAPKAEAPAPDVPVAPEIVASHVADRLAQYHPGDRTPQLVADIGEHTAKVLSGEIDLSPEPRVAAYDDPFARMGEEE